MTVSEIQLRIETAFRSVELEDGISLGQALLADRYGMGRCGTEPTAAETAALQQQIRNDWMALTPPMLAAHKEMIFLDAKGFRYYLPAFMRYILLADEPFYKWARSRKAPHAIFQDHYRNQ